jgi:hypothetical protein
MLRLECPEDPLEPAEPRGRRSDRVLGDPSLQPARKRCGKRSWRHSPFPRQTGACKEVSAGNEGMKAPDAVTRGATNTRRMRWGPMPRKGDSPGKGRGNRRIWGSPPGRISRGEPGMSSLCQEDGGQGQRTERVRTTDHGGKRGAGALRRLTHGSPRLTGKLRGKIVLGPV